jgi:hypothetical protein
LEWYISGSDSFSANIREFPKTFSEATLRSLGHPEPRIYLGLRARRSLLPSPP